jgi:hypothetical protein
MMRNPKGDSMINEQIKALQATKHEIEQRLAAARARGDLDAISQASADLYRLGAVPTSYDASDDLVTYEEI